MSGYEVEHNIPTTTTAQQQPPQSRRPDLSTFFSTLELVDTSDPSAHTNVHAVPQPENITAAFRLLANAFEMMRGRGTDDEESAEQGGDVLASMIEVLRQNADDPPTELKGCPDSFLDELERVDKKFLKDGDCCPICGEGFLEDQYPLVVRLPCHPAHRFDLDCIRPWLKVNSTCPLDRKELVRRKEVKVVEKEEESDGEWDDMFA